MQDILSVGEMRMSDAIAISSFVPGMELMRRAGEGIFRAAKWKPPVAVVCGTGNNAGDGYVTAMMLRDAEIPCELFLQEEKFTQDGKFWFGCCGGIPVRKWAETDSLRGYGTVLDCIFGTGFHGKAEGEAQRMIHLINESGAYVVSADINSGLNGDNGMAETAVRSDLTVCVGSWQPGHFLNMAGDLIREKVCVDIGIPPKGRGIKLFEGEDAAALFPPRKHFSHKGDYGTIALMGGSLRYSGAIRLAALANAGMRAGAGIVRLCAPETLCEKMIPEILEATLFPLAEENGSMIFREDNFREALQGTRSAAFGMGAGNTKETEKAVSFLLREYEGTLILDADGLNALAAMDCAGLAEARGKVILTPHPGEFSRLSGKTMEKIRNNHDHHGRNENLPDRPGRPGHGNRRQRRRAERDTGGDRGGPSRHADGGRGRGGLDQRPRGRNRPGKNGGRLHDGGGYRGSPAGSHEGNQRGIKQCPRRMARAYYVPEGSVFQPFIDLVHKVFNLLKILQPGVVFLCILFVGLLLLHLGVKFRQLGGKIPQALGIQKIQIGKIRQIKTHASHLCQRQPPRPPRPPPCPPGPPWPPDMPPLFCHPPLFPQPPRPPII